VSEARRMLNELERRSKRNDQLYFQALASAALGDRERAFALIEELYRTRSLELLSLKGDPAWDDLRGDPRVRELLQREMPGFTRGWTPGTSSFRPLEEEGRNLSAHASNELIHVDAGAYGATHGDRILRFFVNLNPSRERVWISKGTFDELFARHGHEAGVDAGPLEPAVPERALSGLLSALQRRFPMARVLDTSPYDRRMRRFHNWMKDTKAFQEPPHERISFAPFSAWMVLTDGVSHACVRGQHALVDTFLVPLRNCQRKAPYHLLAGSA